MRRHLLTESSGTVTKAAKPKAGFTKGKGGGELFHWPSVKTRHVAINAEAVNTNIHKLHKANGKKNEGGGGGTDNKWINFQLR